MKNWMSARSRGTSAWLRSWRNHRGQALTEAALVLPVLVFLTLGIIEFSRAFLYANLLTHAAREGARTAAVSGNASRDRDTGLFHDSGAIRSFVERHIQTTVPAATVDVSVTQRTLTGVPLVYVTVAGRLDLAFTWPFLPDHFTINRTVTFRDEGRRGDGGSSP
jgi:Flp pilus assembly protein TadG